MFKYISDILKQFTSAQRMLALIILLISIISISYITMITKSPEELINTISMQKETSAKNQQYISELSLKVNCLNDSILKMNENCNEKAIEREKIYVKKMIEQQKYVNDAIDEIKELMAYKNKTNNIFKMEKTYEIDSIPEKNKPSIVGVVEDSKNYNIDKVIIKKLNKIKTDIKSQ